MDVSPVFWVGQVACALPTNRHAVVPWPDCLTGHHNVDCVEYPYQCTLDLSMCNGRTQHH